jgi:mono/diheme cytochrome c family protein
MGTRTGVLLFAVVMALSACVAMAASIDPIERGRELAEGSCARCHAIANSGSSPNPWAPPFRTLYKRYPVDALEQAFATGLKVGHRDMPGFVFKREQIRDLLAYLRNLDPCARPSSDAAAMAQCFEPL